MGSGNRVDRLNSLLVEVISEVIRMEVKNPHLPPLVTITAVDISNDLSHAKVHVSVIGSPEAQKKAIEVLNISAGFIAVKSSKRVTMRTFPELRFYLDDSAEKRARIDTLLNQIHEEQKRRDE